jgi:predicted RNase H-like nuclease
MRVVGVDGFKDGWVAVALEDGAFAEARCFGKLDELVHAYPGAKAIGIDIPIGYPEKGPRQADLEARKALRARGRSVFDACPPQLLECADFAAARARADKLGLPCPSQQSFALVPKMRDAERMSRTDARLHEVHPEVSFMWMAGGESVAASKRTWSGFWLRHKLLVKQGIKVPPDFDNGELVGIDDVLDAAAAAWSAHRIVTGEARSYPEKPTQLDAAGRPVAIWY